jgi:hypothetical protein
MRCPFEHSDNALPQCQEEIKDFHIHTESCHPNIYKVYEVLKQLLIEDEIRGME